MGRGSKIKQCVDCKDGEHDNYDDDILLVVVHDPDTKKLFKRSYMCEAHRVMYADDGYELFVNGERIDTN